MRKVDPFFSVLIVNYNAGELLQSAINSLKNQTFKDFELVLVDNNSSDSSIDGLDLEGVPNIRVLRECSAPAKPPGNGSLC